MTSLLEEIGQLYHSLAEVVYVWQYDIRTGALFQPSFKKGSVCAWEKIKARKGFWMEAPPVNGEHVLLGQGLLRKYMVEQIIDGDAQSEQKLYRIVDGPFIYSDDSLRSAKR